MNQTIYEEQHFWIIILLQKLKLKMKEKDTVKNLKLR